MNRLAEEFSIPEDVEEESGRFQDSFLRMRSPLLASEDTDVTNSELRHRSAASASLDPLENDDDGEADWSEELEQRRRFQPHQQRILDRSGEYGQSRGRWGVERRRSSTVEERRRRRPEGSRCSRCPCLFYKSLCRKSNYRVAKDWFFLLAYKKTYVLFLLLFVSYLLIIGCFGFIYLSLSILGSKQEVNPDGSTKVIAFCDMDINDHMEAMYFSLSTMTTIGYGVSDYFFGGCYTPLLVVLLQICTAIVFDAVAVGLIFHRISRGASRSRSILFSDKAVIRTVKGVPHLMFRLGERRKYHLIDATVRVYCVRHERIPNYHPYTTQDIEAHLSSNGIDSEMTDLQVHVETTAFVSREMRLVQPDDRFGSHLWMGLPQVVVHRIDEHSPLLPSAPLWFDAGGNAHPYPPTSESEAISSSSQVDLLGGGSATNSNTASKLENIQHFLMDRDIELVVLVEGTDEGTGAATQARHSYKLCDIAWNHRFADCVHPYSQRQRSGPSSLDPVLSIDFGKFHDILPAPENCEACAYVPDSS